MLDSISSFVPAEEAATCLGPRGDGTLTLACLTEALKGVPGGRAPGSDGLTYEALKAFWPVLGALLVSSCTANEAFSSGTEEGLQLTRSQRSGVIQLIHKGGGKPVDDIAAHRPITLLNCDYKVLARVAGLDQKTSPRQSTSATATVSRAHGVAIPHTPAIDSIPLASRAQQFAGALLPARG
jgi:hypothetical protein